MPKELAKEVWQCLPFVLLAGEEILFCSDICLEALEVN
jgi:hypothetical protein